jgi:hypothetical protein
MPNTFIIGAYWGSRAEPLPQVRDKILQTLQKLTGADEQFINWYETGMSRKEAQEKKVLLNTETVERLCLERVKKGELNELGIAKMGFLFSLWTGHPDDETSSITFSVGTSSKWVTNSCVLKLPYEGDARARLLQSTKAKKILSILTETWNPDYAVLTSDALRDKLEVGNRIGWITYRKEIKRTPKLSNKIIYEKTGNGHWFYPASGSFENGLANELLPIKESI